MKKIIAVCCGMSAWILLGSCSTSRNATTLISINGEWNIIEISNRAVVPPVGNKFPFIGFDTESGRMYGISGCNRMMGSFDVNAKPGKIKLNGMGGTKMQCTDMSLEQNILTRLAQVKRYKTLNPENIALYGSSKSPLMVLQRREEGENKRPEKRNERAATIADLEGSWLIKKIGEATTPEGMEQQPFLEFNVTEKRVNGHAGCNILNGSFETDDEKPASIRFPQIITTLRACPDGATEQLILQALNRVCRFDCLEESVGLYDEDDILLLLLKRKNID